MPHIRDAVRDDAPDIAAIYNESIVARDSTMQLDRVDPDTVASWIDGLGSREALLVLEEDAEGMGYGLLERYSDRRGYRCAATTSVYVRRARTGEGRGTALQGSLIERGRAHAYHHLVARLWAANERSRALHRKFDYELVGVQKEIGRVGGTWRDVAIMQKLLSDGASSS